MSTKQPNPRKEPLKREWHQLKQLWKQARKHSKAQHKQQAMALYLRAYRLVQRKAPTSLKLLEKSLDELRGFYQRHSMYGPALRINVQRLEVLRKQYPPGHPERIQSMISVGIVNFRLARYKQAITWYQKTLRALQKNPRLAKFKMPRVLRLIAMVHRAKGKYRLAEATLRQALALQSKALGPSHTRLVRTLNSLGRVYNSQGKYDKALAVYRRALAIRRKKAGRDSSLMAILLTHIGAVYRKQGKFGQALRHQKQAIAILKRTLPPNNPGQAHALNALSLIYSEQGFYPRAKKPLQRAIQIYRKRLGATHPYVAIAMHNMAMLLERQGLYREAIEHSQQALAIGKKRLGHRHAFLAHVYQMQARLHIWQDHFGKALPLLRQALSLRRQALGPGHPFVSLTRLRLAHLLKLLARPQEARALLDELLQTSKGKAKRHMVRGNTLRALGELAEQDGQLSRALQLYRRSLNNYGKYYPASHPKITFATMAVARLMRKQGDKRQALILLRKALGQLKRKFGPRHVFVATAMSQLASLYGALAQPKKAILLGHKALVIFRQTLGPHSLQMVRTLRILTRLHLAQAQPDKAMPYIHRAWKLQWRVLQDIFALSSQRQKLQYLRTLEETRDLYMHTMQQLPKGLASTKQWWRRGIRLVWQSKGLLFRLWQAHQRTLMERSSPQRLRQYQAWKQTRRQLAQLFWRGPIGKKRSKWQHWRAQIQRLRRRRDKLESQLSRYMSPGDFARLHHPRLLARVTQSLPPQTALIEFVRYHATPPTAHTSAKSRYMAFVLTPEGNVSLHTSSPAAHVEKALRQLRRWLPRIPLASAGGAKRALGRLKTPNAHLVRWLWRPLRDRLKGRKHIYIAPDGALSLLPFEILRLPTRGYLVEQQGISYLLSGSKLPSLRQTSAPHHTAKRATSQPSNHQCNALLVGAPAYGKGQKQPFKPLPGSQREVLQIQQQFKGKHVSLMGTAATKKRFLSQSQRQPQLIHVATHGFFLQTPKKPKPLRLARLLRPISNMSVRWSLLPQGSQMQRLQHSNPLLRAGLALANANQGRGKGIVTAAELSLLPLQQTQLVVLSACDTGLGTIDQWQGVQGIRSALLDAGAQSLLLGLWKVPDRETSHLMTSFYKALHKHQHRYRALRQSQLRMIRHLRKTQGVAHPYYWGAFTLQGNPHRLRGCRL